MQKEINSESPGVFTSRFGLRELASKPVDFGDQVERRTDPGLPGWFYQTFARPLRFGQRVGPIASRSP
jgi:hypothetical protein